MTPTKPAEPSREELADVYEEYIKLLSESEASLLGLARVHGYRCSEASVRRGKELRERIAALRATPAGNDGAAVRVADIITGAMAIARSQGHDPDEPAPLTAMCTEYNAPVPWWMVFTEEAEACLKSVAALPQREAGEPGPWHKDFQERARALHHSSDESGSPVVDNPDDPTASRLQQGLATNTTTSTDNLSSRRHRDGANVAKPEERPASAPHVSPGSSETASPPPIPDAPGGK